MRLDVADCRRREIGVAERGANDGLLRGAALDRYSFVRDGYLQRRRNQVYDGDPPPLKEE